MPTKAATEARARMRRVASLNGGLASHLATGSMPAGHPTSWGAITAGTLLDGDPYPHPVPIYRDGGRRKMEDAA